MEPTKPNNETATCHICGQEFENPTQADLAEHMVFDHPMDLIENRQFQKRVFGLMENLGGQLADFIKGKFKHEKPG